MPPPSHEAPPRPALIRNDPAKQPVTPNMPDRDAACKAFRWDAARSAVAACPGGVINIGHAAVDRHALGPRAGKVAIHWLGAEGEEQRITYAQLARLTNRFANAMIRMGLQRGDRLFILAPRVPELYVAVLGALKAGIVVSPLFSAFGPEPVATRMNLGAGRAILTTRSLYERKVAPVRGHIEWLEHVVLIDGDAADAEPLEGAPCETEPAPLPPGCVSLKPMMDAASDSFVTAATTGEDMALLHFTSGTTGKPKGAIHVHEALVTHYATGLYALDLHDSDVFWCTADPGWVTGMSYGVIAPLLHGVTMIVDEAEFDPVRWYTILRDQGVTVWYTAPTAVRMLMKAGTELARQFSFPALRFVASVGEPLNPEAVWWGQEALGLPIHDNWWQTETGDIMIANTVAMDIKPGSMGKPLPSVQACLARRMDGHLHIVEEADTEGELALRSGWPSMFRGYLNENERYRKCFVDGWYLTGDLARRDADGYYWFVGRADDVIKSAGHLIGPFEVESALMEHPAVVEAGVIGKPDPMLGEMVKAFVTLRSGCEPGEALKRELLAHARTRLGAAVAPKEIDFLPVLPRTRSGKIMRRLLKARELGLPEGDTSTLEGGQ